jgi:ubiquinone/menaquinone biosynthesis C-methylase UbiE
MDETRSGRRSAGVAAIFDRVADTYDNVGVPWFRPIAERLVAGLAPRPGERALDVGSGRGAALFPLASSVGAGGSVSGIDLSPRMVEATSADIVHRGLTNVDLQVMDASDPHFPEAGFDIVASSLVIFFLPDPAAALVNWRKLLVPGGRLGISTFGAPSAVWQAVDAVFRPYLPPGMLDARTTGAAGSFESDEGVEELVRAAGFVDVRTASFDLEVVLTDAEHWSRWSRSHGQRAMWDAVPEREQAGVTATVAEILEDARTSDGTFGLSQGVRLTYAARDAG